MVFDEKNPVIKYFDGIPIKKVNEIRLKVNEFEYERFLKLSTQTKLPVAKIVALSAQPCQICGNDHVAIMIPLGLLSARKTQNQTKKTKKDDSK